MHWCIADIFIEKLENESRVFSKLKRSLLKLEDTNIVITKNENNLAWQKEYGRINKNVENELKDKGFCEIRGACS